MTITDRLRSFFRPQQRSITGMPDWWPNLVSGMMSGYPSTTYGSNKVEELGADYAGLMSGAYAGNPIVFTCINARAQLFSESRFQYQELVKGRPGKLYSTRELGILEKPWPGGTTSQLLKDALIDADIAGNAFIYRGIGLQRMRPDWVTIIAGNPKSDATTWDINTEVIGYGYQPGGPASGKEPIILDADEVAHFKSTHDPSRRFSGMSWMVPVLRDITSDQASTIHKVKYFENAATPNLLVKYPETMSKAAADDWADLFNKEHSGSANAYKTLFLGGGSDAEVVGASLRQADFTSVQAAGELRIASAAGVPPIIIGLSGGLDAATYSNYGQARRAFADLTMRPLWRDMAGALERIIPTPSGSRLWYDDRDISFLQEDVKDAADIQSTQSSAIRQLVDAGFEPETIIAAIAANDFAQLKHSGLYSVQLQPPMPEVSPPVAAPAPAEPPPATLLNSASTPSEIRCANCNRLVAKRTAPGGSFEIKCRGCSALVAA